ncbi:Rap-GAP domain-containing protein [Caenorhabditis elegans]|uniref:Rap-GAP domain-containing protein n=1 Tax=Caenorhabditis elegans TaxID=6239 RepID=A0A486WXF2_CAEEL|nr:Rap-GAP domain-containing protein [Caenorhabditis elegans]VGM69551.1 Rap-GAP domain-containing protein [Caenorhabditis elegans]
MSSTTSSVRSANRTRSLCHHLHHQPLLVSGSSTGSPPIGGSMDEGSSASTSSSATARALDMFNRRGSVLAVVIAGNTAADVLPPSAGVPNTSAVSSSSGVISADQPSSTNSDNDTETFNEWRPPFPRLSAYQDCLSLAAAWGLGMHPNGLDDKPTGASQAQSPSEDDSGDGKFNELLASCPAFRNELGWEPTRRFALSRHTFDMAHTDAHECETWMREHSASEAGILEDVSNVYLGGRLCAARQPKTVIEPQDIGSYYYRHCFISKNHIEYLGMDDILGPISISMVREIVDRKESYSIYRMIVRISDQKTIRVAVPEEALSTPEGSDRATRPLMRELLEIVCPKISFGILRPSIQSPRVEELIMKIDEQPIYTRYKVGIMLCKNEQSTEEQMYNNEFSTPSFDEFLDFLGQRVTLKGFEAYKGGLDTRGDTTGTHSIYSEYQAHEIMFHVSTLLPFTPSNRQQLSRKRHIGNDMVTIVFQEPGALPFSPITVRSHFQHVFIIVRVHNECSENVTYSVAVSRSKDVPAFGPPVPKGACFSKCAEFHDWLLTKIINAENAVHRSKKFATMAARTRREALRDLVENYVGPHQNEGASKIASRFLGGSVKRKERHNPKPTNHVMRGALSWLVDVHDYSTNQRISCVLGVAQDWIVLLERPSGTVLFSTPTHSIIGWATSDTGLKLYYDHGDQLLLRCYSETCTDSELNELIRRLENVTKGDEAKEVVLRRLKTTDNWGFHVQDEGVVTDVEMYQLAWKAGIRQGSRIVEMDSMPISTLSFDKICDQLAVSECVRLLMISPSSDGSPRRGCEDPNCPAVKGIEQMLTPDAFAKQPITYHEMFRQKKLEYPTNSASSSPASSFDERTFSFTATKKTIEQRANNIFRSNNRPNTLSSASVHDNMCTLLNPPKYLNRAQSDEQLRSPLMDELNRKAPLSARESTNERESSELVRIQTHLERTVQEKRALEMLAQQLKKQLIQERQSHDNTKREMERLKKMYEKK